VKRQRVADDLIKDNPAFKDPAVAPVVGLIQNQLAEKFPQATADEISAMARNISKVQQLSYLPPKRLALLQLRRKIQKMIGKIGSLNKLSPARVF
jgi:hypothetical protein